MEEKKTDDKQKLTLNDPIETLLEKCGLQELKDILFSADYNIIEDLKSLPDDMNVKLGKPKKDKILLEYVNKINFFKI